MNDNFEKSVAFVLKWEGGYIDDKSDPGGETKYGISKRSYPALDIKNLTMDEAKAIYRKDYWERSGCDGVPWPMCLVVFDTAVNMGLSRASEFRGRATDWRDYLLLRIEFYCALARRTPRFLRGWINRVTDLYGAAQGS